MKKIAAAVTLAAVLTVTLAVPALAGEGNGPSNMPEEAASHLLDHVRGYGFSESDGALVNGLMNYGRGRVGYGVMNVAWRVITFVAKDGNPPGKSW